MYDDDDLIMARELRIQSKRKKPDWVTILNKKDLHPMEMDEIFSEEDL